MIQNVHAMRHLLFFLSLLVLLSNLISSCTVCAQNDNESLRTTFSISGGAGLRQFSPAPAVQNIGVYVINYKGKPERTGWCGCEYYSLNEKGEVVEVKFDEYNADIHARFGVFKRNGNGWLIDAAYTFSRYSYAYENIPFKFKNYTLSVRNSDLESNGILVGIAKFWHPSLFVRLSGVYFYRYTTGGFDKPIDANYKLNFTENGTGFLVSLADRSENNLAIVPEIGLTSSKQPMELSISAVLPMSRYAISERYSYYRNRILLGEAIASYSTMTFSINIRAGFTLFKGRHRTRTAQVPRIRTVLTPPAVKPELASRQTPPAPNDPPSVHGREPANSRFDKLLNKTITLLVNFEQSKANLLPESYADLNQLVQWMKDNPNAEIRLEGHTDLLDDEQKNMELSRQRVVAVKDYVSRGGISSDRVETAFFGETRPLNRNCPPPNFCPENRRVEMIIKKR